MLRKCYNRKSNRIVNSKYAHVGLNTSYSYTNISSRLKYLKALLLQYKTLGYIAENSSITHENKTPIIKMIHYRINQFQPDQNWKPNPKIDAYVRCLEFLISNETKYKKVLYPAFEFVINHYKEEKTPLRPKKGASLHVIGFNRIYNKNL